MADFHIDRTGAGRGPDPTAGPRPSPRVEAQPIDPKTVQLDAHEVREHMGYYSQVLDDVEHLRQLPGSQAREILADFPTPEAAARGPRVRITGEAVEVHPTWANTALGSIAEGGRLDVGRLNNWHMRDLSMSDLRLLLRQSLHGHVVDVHLEAPHGTETAQTSAAVGVALAIWSTGDAEAFVRVLAAAPDVVLPYMRGSRLRWFTAQAIMRAFAALRQASADYSAGDASAAATLVSRFLENQGSDEPEMVQPAIEQILTEAGDVSPYDCGLLAGTIVAGLVPFLGGSDGPLRIYSAMQGAMSTGTAAARCLGAALLALQQQPHRLLAAFGERLAEGPPAGWGPREMEEACAGFADARSEGGLVP